MLNRSIDGVGSKCPAVERAYSQKDRIHFANKVTSHFDVHGSTSGLVTGCFHVHLERGMYVDNRTLSSN